MELNDHSYVNRIQHCFSAKNCFFLNIRIFPSTGYALKQCIMASGYWSTCLRAQKSYSREWISLFYWLWLSRLSCLLSCPPRLNRFRQKIEVDSIKMLDHEHGCCTLFWSRFPPWTYLLSSSSKRARFGHRLVNLPQAKNKISADFAFQLWSLSFLSSS